MSVPYYVYFVYTAIHTHKNRQDGRFMFTYLSCLEVMELPLFNLSGKEHRYPETQRISSIIAISERRTR